MHVYVTCEHVSLRGRQLNYVNFEGRQLREEGGRRRERSGVEHDKNVYLRPRKVDIRLPGKGNSNS